MAVVFQEYGRSLFPWMTVRQNVELPLKEKKVAEAERERLVAERPGGGRPGRRARPRTRGSSPAACSSGSPSPGRSPTSRRCCSWTSRSRRSTPRPGPTWRTSSAALWQRLGVTVLFVTHDIDEAVYLGQRVLVLSSSPTVVLEDVAIDLPDERDQLTTRSTPRFAELRAHVYEQIQQAKRGHRPAAATVSSTES